MTQSVQDFIVGDYVVYPAHGVGQINGVETQEVAGLSLEVYVITFDHEKMTLRVPTRKAKTAGLRPLASGDVVSPAMVTLKGRARVKRTMWSRRAQEYEADRAAVAVAGAVGRRYMARTIRLIRFAAETPVSWVTSMFAIRAQ